MRIRTIKPDFWTSLTVHDLSLPARLTFIGMWNYADDEGRGVDDPRLLCAAIWPLEEDITPVIVESHLEELERAGCIQRYGVEGRSYFQIGSWLEHQRISHPKASTIPEPSGGLPEASLKVTALSSQEVEVEQGRGNREGKGTGNTAAFAAFWPLYPRREGKRTAEAAFRRALSRADAGTIIDGAVRYRDDPNRVDEFTAHPATWLNRDGWLDDPLPDRGRPDDPAARLARMAGRLREAE